MDRDFELAELKALEGMKVKCIDATWSKTLHGYTIWSIEFEDGTVLSLQGYNGNVEFVIYKRQEN